MNKVYVTEDQGVQIEEKLTAQFSSVWKVAELSPRGLMTTSGRLGTNTLDDTAAAVIANYSGRPVDWIISLDGATVAVIHPDDTIDKTISP